MVCKKELEEILDGCVFISIATLVAISKIAVLIVRIWGAVLMNIYSVGCLSIT